MKKQKDTKIPHFTGQKRDINQLKALSTHLTEERTFVFVGCSTGEEIIDFQELFHKKDSLFLGIDYDSETVNQANQNNYQFPTKIFVADILKNDFFETVEAVTDIRGFEIVICRNLLIYYDEKKAKLIIGRLAALTTKFLILGISDPFSFLIEDNKVEIGNTSFEVVDFDNRIFKKIEI